MLLDLGSGERHRTANVFDLQPRAVETIGRRALRQHTRRPLFHHLRYKLVRIKQRPTNSGEQRTLTNTPRIVTYIRDLDSFIAREPCICYYCESIKSYRVVHVYKIFSRSGAMAQRKILKPRLRCVVAPLREKLPFYGFPPAGLTTT